MPRKLRVALVGCGAIAESHLLSWQAIPDVEVVALCDDHPEHFDHLIAKFGNKRTFSDYGNLLNVVDFEIADIATRPHSHKELVVASADAGKHVLCQKPFAPTLLEAREMIEICDLNDVRFMICENWRWFIWYRVIHDVLRSGVIGEVKYARMTSRSSFTIARGKEPPAILRHPQGYLKGMPRMVLYEMGTHLLDVFRFLFGDPLSVYAQIGRMSADIVGEDFAFVTLNFGEMHGSIDLSWCSREAPEEQESEHLLIEGSKGSIIMDRDGRVQIVGDHEVPTVPEYDYRNESKLTTHHRLHRHFIDGLLEEKVMETDARDNIKTLEIVLRSYESAEENKVKTLQGDRLLGSPS